MDQEANAIRMLEVAVKLGVRLHPLAWPRAQKRTAEGDFWRAGTISGTSGLFGKTAKKDVYDQAYYFSDQIYLHRLVGWRTYRGLWRELRGPASLVALDYLVRIRRMLGTAPASEVERRFAKLMRRRLGRIPLPDVRSAGGAAQ